MLKSYKVWDAPTRLFHWVNFITVLLLILVGLVMLFKGDIGIVSLDAKVGLKTIHVLIGYVFVINLVIRIVWGFVGNRFARWSTGFPGAGFGAELKGYVASIKAGDPKQYMGHNPLGRLAVMVIFVALSVMAVTGLVRAGTDIYYPPFGSMAASYVAAEGVDPATLEPYVKIGVDGDKLKALGEIKRPFGEVHVYTAYFLMLMILLHIGAVVKAELAGEGTLVSAMISGRKTLSKEPEDLNG